MCVAERVNACLVVAGFSARAVSTFSFADSTSFLAGVEDGVREACLKYLCKEFIFEASSSLVTYISNTHVTLEIACDYIKIASRAGKKILAELNLAI